MRSTSIERTPSLISPSGSASTVASGAELARAELRTGLRTVLLGLPDLHLVGGRGLPPLRSVPWPEIAHRRVEPGRLRPGKKPRDAVSYPRRSDLVFHRSGRWADDRAPRARVGLRLARLELADPSSSRRRASGPRVDLRGHGHSAITASGYSQYDFARDCANLIRHVKGGPVVAVGHSLGAFIVSALAVEYPELVRSQLSRSTLVMGAAATPT